MADNDELSERELEILRLVATGASNKEIAQRLVISTNTVKVHLRNIFTKIQVASRTEAAMYAVHHGLVEPARVAASLETETIPPVELELATPSTQQPLWLLVLILAVVSGLLVVAIGYYRQASIQNAQVVSAATSEAMRWRDLAGMPTPRQGMGVVAYESQIYAIAGETAQGVSGAVERYDPTTNAWIARASKSVPATDVGAAVIGGLIYVPGGRLASGEVSDVLEIYDPREDRWTRGADLPVPMSAYAIVSFEGKLILFGGWNGQRYLDTVFEYNPDLDEWKSRTPMPAPRAFAGAALAENKVFVMGGYAGGSPLTDNYAYLPTRDGVNDPWQARAPLPDGRYAMGVASIVDIIQVIGGVRAGKATASSLEYVPSLDQWQEVGGREMKSWSHLSLVALAPHVYALGGLIDGQPTSQNLSYQAIYTVVLPLVR